LPNVIPVNPFARVKTSKARTARPLLWTAPRVDRWHQTGEIPGPVMVWTREQCGAFLDSIESERLYSLYHLAAYYGPRRNELAGLHWADTDLTARRVPIRGDVKSEDSDGIIAIDPATGDVLRAWRKTQQAELMAWAGVWTGRHRSLGDRSLRAPNGQDHFRRCHLCVPDGGRNDH
jgi:integrase